MRIKLEPCPEAGTKEVYHVFLCEDDDDAIVAVVGHVRRADDGGDSWELRAPGKNLPPMIVQAANIDELRESLKLRVQHVNIEADRLSHGVMVSFVDDLLDPVIDLAQKTDSTGSVVHALVNVVGRLIATETPPDKQQHALDGIIEHLREAVKGYGDARSQQKQLADILRAKFKAFVTSGAPTDLFGNGDDDEKTPKH